MLLIKPVNVIKHRPEISPSETFKLHRLYVFVKFLPGGDLFILLNIGIALYYVQVDLGKKALPLIKYVIGLGDEFLH